jgi:hypothetical protein
MKRLLFLLTLVFIFTGCKDKRSFSIKGVIKGETKNYIYIYNVDVNTPVFLDSAKINRKGSFHFKIKTSEQDFYQLGFSTSDFITLLAGPGESINLMFEGKNLFEKYSVEGSEGSEKIKILDLALTQTKRKLDSLTTLYSTISRDPDFEIKGPLLDTEYTNLVKEQRKKNIEFIISNTKSLASIKALYQRISEEAYVLYEPRDLQYYKIVTDSLTRYYPNSKHVQALARDFNNELGKMYTSNLQELTRDMPEAELDPDLKDPGGKRIRMSSLRGKYVLLTFWTTSSRESILENHQLKEYYRLYNKKGFEIYQISLDKNEAEWKAGVKFDELPWISTREDDPSDPKNAILFNVKSLPTNYLFDKEGVIIASNLHGKALQLKLEQLFNR